MDIEDLEEETYLYIRYRCDAGTYDPPKEHKIKMDKKKEFIMTMKKKKIDKNKVEVDDKDLDSEDDEEDEADMDSS